VRRTYVHRAINKKGGEGEKEKERFLGNLWFSSARKGKREAARPSEGL